MYRYKFKVYVNFQLTWRMKVYSLLHCQLLWTAQPELNKIICTLLVILDIIALCVFLIMIYFRTHNVLKWLRPKLFIFQEQKQGFKVLLMFSVSESSDHTVWLHQNLSWDIMSKLLDTYSITVHAPPVQC